MKQSLPLFVNLFLLLTTYISYKAHAQTIDTLIDVGSYKLHFNIIKGKGIPILFESGGGDDGAVWNELTKNLRDSINTTLITYDRAGTGKSGIDTSNINVLNEVKGLEIGLKKLGYINDLFIVAHSLGGSYALLYSSRHSKTVKGCIFIDINLPCFMTKQKAKELKEAYADKMVELKKQMIGVYYILVNYEKTNNLLRKTSFPSSIPATVIGAEIANFKGIDGLTWKACLKSFGELPNHIYVLAEKSSHYVYKDNPELVTNEIVNMYRRETIERKRIN